MCPYYLDGDLTGLDSAPLAEPLALAGPVIPVIQPPLIDGG
jgi:hypothetical protein